MQEILFQIDVILKIYFFSDLVLLRSESGDLATLPP